MEFAIVLPVLLLLILGILYFGRYESYASQMTQLSEVGVRDAAVDYPIPSGASANGSACAASTTSSPNNGNLACYIASQASGELASGNGSTVQAVSVWVDCDSNTSGSSCTADGSSNVTVCLRAQVQFPGLQGVGGTTVFQQATMRIESAGIQDSSLTESSSNAPSATAPGASLPANSPC